MEDGNGSKIRMCFRGKCLGIDQSGYVGTGEKYGVSDDNAIRRRKRFYEKGMKIQKSHIDSHMSD